MVDVIILMVATPLSSTRLKPEVVPDKEFGSTVNVNDCEYEGQQLVHCSGGMQSLYEFTVQTLPSTLVIVVPSCRRME